MSERQKWYDIEPRDAAELNLSKDTSIEGPLGEDGKVCPWPWEPQQLAGAPIGMYHCGWCGSMVIAGMRHPDYRDFDTDIEAALLGVKIDPEE